MTKQGRDDVLTELEAALDVRPSPEFAARVRQRVQAQSVRPWWSRASSSWAIAAVASAASVVVVVWVVRHEMTLAQKPVRAVAVAQTIPSTERPSTPTAIDPVPALGPRPVATVIPARAPSASHYEVLVPPDEGLALWRFLGRLAEQRTVVPPEASGVSVVVAELPVPSSIAVTPMVIEPLPGTTGGGGGRN